ncbi:Putative inner membrane protein [Klebsiella pneumoniae IS43]|uniref:Inner membrane protein n=1 Tax=Klebsiella pneumoniae IS43 TaxID=1432552 RepID=W1DHD1_KLEPN|nr:Putative inner membrane protein [Klebsiella pneumoniae IS43]
MEWLIKHWWILVLVFLVGVIINVIKDLNRVDHKKIPQQQTRSAAAP